MSERFPEEIRLGTEEMEWVKPHLDSAEETIASVIRKGSKSAFPTPKILKT